MINEASRVGLEKTPREAILLRSSNSVDDLGAISIKRLINRGGGAASGLGRTTRTRRGRLLDFASAKLRNCCSSFVASLFTKLSARLWRIYGW